MARANQGVMLPLRVREQGLTQVADRRIQKGGGSYVMLVRVAVVVVG